MNNAINEIKNTLEGTNGRITDTESRISEVEDRMVEINEIEDKEKQIKRNEGNFRVMKEKKNKNKKQTAQITVPSKDLIQI